MSELRVNCALYTNSQPVVVRRLSVEFVPTTLWLRTHRCAG